MDFTISEKYKNNLLAFGAGAIVSGGLVWAIAGNLHAQKVDILETSLREAKIKLAETKGQLTEAQLSLANANDSATATAIALKTEQDKQSRRQELASLLRSIDKDIKARKQELILASPISPNDSKGELYLRAESELASLEERRNEVLAQQIASSGSR